MKELLNKMWTIAVKDVDVYFLLAVSGAALLGFSTIAVLIGVGAVSYHLYLAYNEASKSE